MYEDFEKERLRKIAQMINAFEERGWSLRYAAKKTGLSFSYLSKLKRSKVPNVPVPETVDKLVYGLELSYVATFYDLGYFRDCFRKKIYSHAYVKNILPEDRVIRIISDFVSGYKIHLSHKTACEIIDDLDHNDFSRYVYVFFNTLIKEQEDTSEFIDWVPRLCCYRFRKELSDEAVRDILWVILNKCSKYELNSYIYDYLFFLFDVIPSPFWSEKYTPHFAKYLTLLADTLKETVEYFDVTGEEGNYLQLFEENLGQKTDPVPPSLDVPPPDIADDTEDLESVEAAVAELEVRDNVINGVQVTTVKITLPTNAMSTILFEIFTLYEKAKKRGD